MHNRSCLRCPIMMGAGAEQHNTRCALLGGGVEVIASCTTFALCMNTRVCTVCTGGIIITITLLTPPQLGAMVSQQMVTFALTRDTQR